MDDKEYTDGELNDPLQQLILEPGELATLKLYNWRDHPPNYHGKARQPICCVPGCGQPNITSHRRCLKHWREYNAERVRLNNQSYAAKNKKLKEDLKWARAKADQYKLEKCRLAAKLENITCIIEGKPLIWTDKKL